MVTGNAAIIETNPEQDRLHLPDPVPSEYSENLVLMGYDAVADVALYFHFSRMHSDPELWEGDVAVYRSGGALLVDQSLGKHGDTDTADTGVCSFHVEQPLRRWRARFHGAATACTTADAAAGLVDALPSTPTRVDVVFDGLFGTWSAGAAMDTQDWGDAHLEQGGRITGSIAVGDERITFDGTGFRDHTRGRRNYTGLDRHTWTYGHFPSGRTFLVLEAWHDPGVYQTFGFVAHDGELVAATPRSLPDLTDCQGSPRAFTIELDSGVGPMTISAEALHAMAFTLQAPLAMPLGADWSHPRNTIGVECPAKVVWNGEVGYGWVERTNRAQRLARPR
jgi:hypothetical protein